MNKYSKAIFILIIATFAWPVLAADQMFHCSGYYYKSALNQITDSSKPFRSMEFAMSVNFDKNLVTTGNEVYPFSKDLNGILKWLDEGKYPTSFDRNTNQMIAIVGTEKKPMTFVGRCLEPKPLVKDEDYYENLQFKADRLECENKIKIELKVNEPQLQQIPECYRGAGILGDTNACVNQAAISMAKYSNSLTINQYNSTLRERSGELMELCLYNKKWIDKGNGYQRIK